MKMLKKLSNLFRKVAKSFDRYIVIPLTRLVIKITGNFDKSGHKLENILSKQTTLLFLSLFISIGIFILVDQKILVLNTSGAEVFKAQKVELLYNEERFVITGAPETVDITLIGSKADLYIAKQSSKHNVKLDLTDIKEPGTYKVDIEYESGLGSIDYSVNPSQVTIVVYLKETRNQTLSYKIINADHLDSAVEISNVSLNVDQVVISGADFQLEKVATVEALIDVDKLTSTSTGKQRLEDIILKAYDKDGNVVDVEINKTTKVTADVEITSSSRVVPLNFVPVNEVPFGKAISSYTFSQETVVVYGPTDVLDALERNGIDILVDVSKLTGDYSSTVEIPKPTGVKKLSINKINVDIKITESGEPVTMTLKIDALNTPAGLTAGAATADDVEVLVDIKGARNIISNLRDTEIQAYVDLSGYTTAGTYDVPIKIKANTANARLATYVPKRATVKIVLTKN
jgi:YbbR domain-containing protein